MLRTHAQRQRFIQRLIRFELFCALLILIQPIPITYAELAESHVLFGGSMWAAAQEPSVIVEGDKIRLWYTAGAGASGSALAYAESSDGGVNWTHEGSLSKGAIMHSAISRIDNQYVIYYVTSTNGDLLRMTSADGIHWGDVQIAIQKHQEQWSIGWNNSFVWKDGSTWRGLFEGCRIDGLFLIAYAISSDGLSWTFPTAGYLADLQINGGTSGGPDLVQTTPGDYRLLYHASTNGLDIPTDIYEAHSTDLIHWTVNTTPLLARPEAFAGDQVADPALIEWQGRALLFFEGVDNDSSTFKIAFQDMGIVR